MRKLFMFVLAAAFLLMSISCVIAEETATWPVMNFAGVKSSLRSLGDEDGRHQSYFGPAKSYHGAGAYKPGKARSVTALFREGDFVLVDMQYQTAGRRCLYFRASSLTNASVEEVQLVGYPAKTTSLLIPMQGPGTEYEYVLQTVPSKYADYDLATLAGMFGGSVEIYEARKPQRLTVYLDQGTDVQVFFEMNGWVFGEFSCDLGLVRAWLPVNSVAAQ